MDGYGTDVDLHDYEITIIPSIFSVAIGSLGSGFLHWYDT